MDKQRKQNCGVRKRSPNACVRCRQQKIRCTGTFPCQPCSRRQLACTFDDDTQKITVTKGFIKTLQSKADQPQSEATRQHAWHPSHSGDVERSANQDNDVATWLGSVENTVQPTDMVGPSNSEGDVDASGAQLMNPLALDAGNYMTDNHGRPYHLGKSSNWSFGRRVLRMTCERLGVQLPTEGLHFEGSVYNLEWQILKNSPQAPKHALPAPDYAVYLINATKFHCGQMFHLFDEEDFMQYFAIYHDDSQGIDKVPQLWYIHYLLIIAFGKAFVARNAHDGRPPGAELFLEAMRHLPEVTLFSADSIEPIEILICAALYLQCLDFRSTAYNLIGQALRKSLEQGMHTQMSTHDLKESTVQRCRKVWWTVYMLDRQMSSLMGLPLAIRDDEVSAPLPTYPKSSQRSIGLELHVKLSRVIADILNTVYSTEGRLAKKFIISTKEALKSIASVTDLLKQHFELPDAQSVAGISRTSAYLHLLHHQCIALTTRPLAYSFLERRLKNPDGITKYYVPTGSVRALLKTCIESAQQILHMLSSLQNQGLLESFLPFDLESVFISTIILIMSTAIDPTLLEDHGPWSDVAYAVLDEMASRGNVVAVLRKRELQKLASVLAHLPPPRVANPSDPNQQYTNSNVQMPNGDVDTAANGVGSSSLDYQPFDSLLWQDELSAEQLMMIADSLEMDGLDWMTTSLGESSSQSQIL